MLFFLNKLILSLGFPCTRFFLVDSSTEAGHGSQFNIRVLKRGVFEIIRNEQINWRKIYKDLNIHLGESMLTVHESMTRTKSM